MWIWVGKLGQPDGGRPGKRVVILCRVDMGWKGVEVASFMVSGSVVILCRVDMGWKEVMSTSGGLKTVVVILCRVDMGWKVDHHTGELLWRTGRNPLPCGYGLERRKGPLGPPGRPRRNPLPCGYGLESR